MTKKLIHFLRITLGVLILTIVPAGFIFAQSASGGGSNSGNGGGSNGPTLINPLTGSDSLSSFLDQILTVVIDIGAVVIVFFIIYAGFLYVTARGSEEQIKKAHMTLTWTVVGAAVILGAKVISAAISGTVGALK
ncbi:MAG: hypothetical protein PHF79_00485 [Candidatus Pacebacteria bacterium]|nr:hypothetical protein [Candidatus Paceibacterota bacterium]